MIRLIMVRHAESARNAGEPTGANKLTEKGKKQAKMLARYLGDNRIDYFYCSNTLRGMETLDQIIEGRDDDFGISFSKLIKPKSKKEKFVDVKKRIELFLDDLKIEFEGDTTVAMVGHKIPIKLMLYLLTKKECVCQNGSIQIVEIGENKVEARAVDVTEHLVSSK